MRARVKSTLLGGVILASAIVMVSPSAALASTGTATLTGGSFSITAPTTVAFAATLNGVAQNVQSPQVLDVLDNTGSGAGWNVTLTSTTFTSGADTLSTSAVSDLSAAGACDVGGGCSLGTNGLTYPIGVPAAVSAPTAVRIQAAAAGTGLSPQTWTHSMQLAIPAIAHAGSYSSTWTYSLVSAP